MTKLTLAQRKDKVLSWVNARRKELGLGPLTELPKGIRKDIQSCPIAEGLSNDYKVGVFAKDFNQHFYWRFLANGDFPNDQFLNHHSLPNYVNKFVSDFDKGKYPELDRY